MDLTDLYIFTSLYIAGNNKVRLRGTNHVELRLVRILIVSLVDLVQALVTFVQALVDLVQNLVVLVHAHSPQGGLIRRQVTVRPGSVLVGAVCWVFMRGVRWKQVCYSKGRTGYIDTYTAPGAQQWGLMLGYIVLFQS